MVADFARSARLILNYEGAKALTDLSLHLHFSAVDRCVTIVSRLIFVGLAYSSRPSHDILKASPGLRSPEVRLV